MEEKIMHFANFNITFGEQEEPMLTHFMDIIYPAFTSDLKRGRDGEYPKFTFSDVKVKMSKSGEYILVGNYIKDTQYTIHTTIQDGELKPTPANVPTAPYSRFIVFLKNHRMILVRNESVSPDIRSFQATVRSILNQYIRTKNKGVEDKAKKLPDAIVNIVDIPLKDDIDVILKGISKIRKVELLFFPLNNDINNLPVAQAINNEMHKVGSKRANAKFISPDSKEGVKNMIADTAGLARTRMFVTDNDGEDRTINENSFTSNVKIPFDGDIENEADEYLMSMAQKDDIIKKTSNENQILYDKFINLLNLLL